MGIEDPGPFAAVAGVLGGLAGLLIYALIGYVAWRAWKRWRKTEEADNLLPSGDATRYALASAVLEGSRFRRTVIALANHRYRAKAVEPGLDFPLVLAACRRYEREDRLFNWIIFFGGTVGALYFLTSLMPFLVYSLIGEIAFGETFRWITWGGLMATLVLIIVKEVRDIGRLAPFRRENYDLQQVRNQFLGAEPAQAAPGAFENVHVYGSRNPFVGFGTRVGGWQAAVELDRAADPAVAAGAPTARGSNGSPAPVDPGSLLRAVDESVSALSLPNLEIRFPLMVSGTEVNQLPKLLPEKYARPVKQADAETLGRFWYFADPRARSYRAYIITDWAGELVFSYMLRFVRRGHSLTIETVQLVLPPIAEKYRRIDNLQQRGFFRWILWLLGVVARSPLTLINAAVGSFYSLFEMLNLAGPDTGDSRDVSRNPAYNYGALTSLRETMASQSYHVYFQRIDAYQYFTAIDRRVLNAAVATLEAAGVDVSMLQNQAQLIVNNSTNIVGNAGPVTIGSITSAVASGPNASAGAGGIAQAAGRAASAATGGAAQR